MFSIFRAVFIFAKSLRRIAASLESILDLYRLDCASRGLFVIDDNTPQDQVDIAYGPKAPVKKTDLISEEEDAWAELLNN